MEILVQKIRLLPGCGFLANLEYEGYIHSVSDVVWSTFNPDDGLTYALDFSYVPFENDYLSAEIPTSLILKQNYPNPFNPVTNIEFVLSKNDYVVLNIYDIKGRVVNNLVSQYLVKGTYSFQWNAKNMLNEDLPSGIYIYQLNTSDLSITKKMTLLR